MASAWAKKRAGLANPATPLYLLLIFIADPVFITDPDYSDTAKPQNKEAG